MSDFTWHRECGHDPAVSIDNMGRNSVNNTPNGLSHKLCHCDDHWEGEEEDCGEGTVDPKNRIINNNLLPFEVVLETRKEGEHFEAY